MKSALALFVIGLVVLPLGGDAPARCQDPAPAETPPGRSDVVDRADLFSKDAVESARRALRQCERDTGVATEIRVIDSLNGETIEDAAQEAVRQANGLGVFMLIARKERKLRIRVRNAYESRLPRERQEAVREAMFEGFESGKFDQGLKRGVDEIVVSLRLSGPPASAPAAPEITARDGKGIVRNRIGLTLDGARTILTAAEAKAAEMNQKMNLAVVDEGGHLIAFVRMDGARPASAITAQTKAISAATFRQSTGPLPVGTASPDLLLNLSVPAAAAAGGGRITPLLGGLTIEVEGQVIGAIGVGGGSGEQDAEVARAGIEAFLKSLSPPEGAESADP